MKAENSIHVPELFLSYAHISSFHRYETLEFEFKCSIIYAGWIFGDYEEAKAFLSLENEIFVVGKTYVVKMEPGGAEESSP